MWKIRSVDARERARTERGNTRGGATKKREISRNLLSINLNFSVHPRSFFQDGWGYDFRRNLSVAWGDFGDYATDLFTDEAEKVIERHSKASRRSDGGRRPLFLYLAHLAVHSGNSYAPLQVPLEFSTDHNYQSRASDSERGFGSSERQTAGCMWSLMDAHMPGPIHVKL